MTSSLFTLRNAVMENFAMPTSIVVKMILISLLIINSPARCANLTSNAEVISVTTMEYAWAKSNKIVVLMMMSVIQDFTATLHPLNANFKNQKLRHATLIPNAKII